MKSESESPIGIKGLLNPTLIFGQKPRILLTEEREETDNARFVAEGINMIFNNSSGSVSQAARKVIQELDNPQGVCKNTKLMADFVMNYITERSQLGMSTHVVSFSELLIVHYKKMSIPLNSFQNELNWWLCLFLEDPANQ